MRMNDATKLNFALEHIAHLEDYINEQKKKLKLIVKIFGRTTPLELNFMQVEKI